MRAQRSAGKRGGFSINELQNGVKPAISRERLYGALVYLIDRKRAAVDQESVKDASFFPEPDA